MRHFIRRFSAWEVTTGAALATLGIVIQADVLRRGIQPAGDTRRYTDGAARLLDGHLLQGAQWLYPGYIAFVAMVSGIGLGLHAIVAIQALLLLMVAIALADLGRRLSGPVAAAAAAFLWLTAIDFTRYLGWQAYILTDAVYASAVVIVLWSIHRALENGGRWSIVAAAAAVAAASVRPNGWLLLPVLVTYLTATRWRTRSGYVLAAALLGLVVVGAELVPGGRLIRGDTARQLAEGRLFWGHEYDPWQLAMPATTPGQTAVSYVTSHPLAVARLALARVLAEAAHIRPAYSSRRNIRFGIWTATMWVLAVLGVWFHRGGSFIWLAVGIVAAQFFLVAVTFADIEGRFLVHVIGPLALLSGLAIGRFANERPKEGLTALAVTG